MSLSSFRFALIGNTDLITKCAKYLLDRNHTIKSIYTPNATILKWAARHNIIIDSPNNLNSPQKLSDIDYLLSISNRKILPKSIWSAPKYATINYHDAPLPKYPGAYATSWAILNNEKSHGITLHFIDDIIDGGNILKQICFPIEKNETAFSLNLKCYHKAYLALTKLIDELTQNGKLKGSKQNLSNRVYYPANKKPKNGGIISWEDCAETIERLHRALNFGTEINSFAIPKFIIKNQSFFPKILKISDRTSQNKPGTIIDYTEKSIEISTSSYNVQLSEIYNLHGLLINIRHLMLQFNLKVGDCLSTFDPHFLDSVRITLENITKHENFWINILNYYSQGNLTNLPLFPADVKIQKYSNEIKIFKKTVVSDIMEKKLLNLFKGNIDFKNIIFSAILIYLYRINNNKPFFINILHKTLKNLTKNYGDLFTKQIPFYINLDSNLNFTQSLQEITQLLISIENHNTYSNDILLRYPGLNIPDSMFTVTIDFTNSDINYLDQLNAGIIIKITNNGFQPSIIIKKNLISKYPYHSIVENLLDHIENLLKQIVQYPEIPIKNISILTPKDAQLIEKYNATDKKYPHDKTIQQLFEKQAQKKPNKIAIIFGQQQLTYSELNKKANQLAHYLLKTGIQPDDLIAISIHRSLEMFIGILGILKSGAAYVPISPDYPDERIKYILNNSRSKIILTSQKLRKKITNCISNKNIKLIEIDKISKFELESIQNLSNINTSRHLAYVIYTSGTTGLPKGVLIEHKSAVNMALGHINQLKISQNDRILQFVNFSFDVSVADWTMTLLSGASLYIIDEISYKSIDSLAKHIEKNGITIVMFPFSVIQNLPVKPFKKLRALISGGESCSKKIIDIWSKNRTFINAYGPTETTVCATMAKDLADTHTPLVHIGKPLQNVKLFVLDENLQQMPIGIPGELYISGPNLARGYLNNGTLTNEKFILKSLYDNSKLFLYKTGDLAFLSPKGNIVLAGRTDQQIKINGFRIEIEEIEEQLIKHPLIQQCAILFQVNKNNEKYLKAYCVVKNSINPSYDEIQSFLEKSLPHYMIPKRYTLLDKLPLTSNNKIDKKTLSQIKEGIELFKKSKHTPPENDIEKQLVKIWERILDQKDIGILDNFFEIGGHSLLASSMISKINKLFKKSIEITNFLYQPTIQNLAKLLKKQSSIKSYDRQLEDISLFNTLGKNPSKRGNFIYPKAIFLTGVTGFLGIYLLKDLYFNTNAIIYCLVREKNHNQAQTKLSKNIIKFLGDEHKQLLNSKRIVSIVGDLSLKRLGLSLNKFEELAKKIDIIYHCGANVHHIYNYQMLRGTNVLSTLEILKLATTKQLKQINYISTINVALLSKNGQEPYINENFIPLKVSEKYTARLFNGYSQTKWISETLLSKAHKRGIPVNIFRPAWITGARHKNMSFSPEHNHLFLLIKGCIQLGFSPDWKDKLYIIPVDFLSNFIVKTSLNQKSDGNVYNILNPHSVEWTSLICWINYYGFPVKIVSHKEWLKKLEKIDKNNALFPLLGLYLDKNSQKKLHLNIIDNSFKNTTNMLKKLNLSFPDIDIDLLQLYFDFLKTIGFLN